MACSVPASLPGVEPYTGSVCFARHVPHLLAQRKMGRPRYDDAVRTQAAFDAASQAAARVQSAVFNAVLSGNDEWKYSRWVLAFLHYAWTQLKG